MCCNALLPTVPEMFASQMLKKDSDMNTLAEIVSAAWTYVSAMDGIQQRKKSVTWDAPVKLPATQLFSGHVVSFLPKLFKDPSLFDMGRRVINVTGFGKMTGMVVWAGREDEAGCRVQSTRNDVEESADYTSAREIRNICSCAV